jgi:serine/threonine protein kinase/Flp pilus assembly protein TadD
VTVKCSRCNTDNPFDSKFCKDCGVPLGISDDVTESFTKTLETPKQILATGASFSERYQIIEKLGRGGMGSVYRVLDKKLNEEVALKLLNSEIASDEKTLERFSNELKLARKIVHKNIGRMYEFMEEQGTHFITMEYVPGEDLKSFIKRVGQLPVGKAISIGKQILEGLEEAHRLGTIHRDLKPGNIMIDKEGNARIMDFGIARSVHTKGMTGKGVIIGTPEYMSPEQAEAQAVDRRSDIYSFGIILFEMLTGQLPFEGDTPLSVVLKQKQEAPQEPKNLNPQISDELNRLILQCMEKDPQNRYQSAADILAELDRIANGLPTTARTSRPKPLTSQEITVSLRMKKVWIPVFIAVAAVVTLVLLLTKSQVETASAPKIENSIAVITFTNQTGDPAYDYLQDVIPNLLITNLENTGFLYVATWERMFDLLKQLGRSQVAKIDSDLGFELCKREGIEAIVVGSYTKAGEVFVTDAKVLDVETRGLMKSTNSRGEGAESILRSQIDELSRDIAQGIGISGQKIDASRLQIAEVTTSSLDAYNHYLKGREAWEKKYTDEARQQMEKAVEYDPEFAVAYLYLAKAQGRLRNVRLESEAWENAKLYANRASEKDRLWIEARYAAEVEKDTEKAIRLFREVSNKYPKDKLFHIALAGFYREKRLFAEALKELEQAVSLDPNYGLAVNLFAYTYTEMKDYEKALEYFRKYVDLFPDDANPIDSMAELYFIMGRLDEAIAKYKEALEIKPDFGVERWISYIYVVKGNYQEALSWSNRFLDSAPSEGLKAQGYLGMGFYQMMAGRFDLAVEAFDEAEGIWQVTGNLYGVSILDLMRWLIHFQSGEYGLYKDYFSKYLDFNRDYAPQFLRRDTTDGTIFLGFFDVREGNLDAAREKLREAQRLLPESEKEDPKWAAFQAYSNCLLQGEILLAEGAFDDAVEVMDNAVPLEVPLMNPPNVMRLNMPLYQDVLARAYIKMGDRDKAISAYEDLITFDPDDTDRRGVPLVYHYRLAKLYQEKDWGGKAIEHYEIFLGPWKDAESIPPDVEDARQRLAGLK